MQDLVTIGETMVAFIPSEQGYLRYCPSFGKKTAGAESNVAIGMAKLGHTSGWVGKIGEDEFGAFILRELRGEGVDISHAVQTCDAPTGLMFKQFDAQGQTSVFYYRKDSAGSCLCPEDIDPDYISGSKILHISGITPALSDSCAKTIDYAVDIARRAGCLVSFDPNIRLKLWSAQNAKAALFPLLSKSDIVLLGEDEGELLLDTDQPREMIARLRDMGVGRIGLKLGAQGAQAADKTDTFVIPPVKVRVVDTVGAGDAFNAGFLAGVLEGRSVETCGRMGAFMGAMAVSSYGDVEGLPNRKAFDGFAENAHIIYR